MKFKYYTFVTIYGCNTSSTYYINLIKYNLVPNSVVIIKSKTLALSWDLTK